MRTVKSQLHTAGPHGFSDQPPHKIFIPDRRLLQPLFMGCPWCLPVTDTSHDTVATNLSSQSSARERLSLNRLWPLDWFKQSDTKKAFDLSISFCRTCHRRTVEGFFPRRKWSGKNRLKMKRWKLAKDGRLSFENKFLDFPSEPRL